MAAGSTAEEREGRDIIEKAAKGGRNLPNAITLLL